jgi:hypothetical protein
VAEGEPGGVAAGGFVGGGLEVKDVGVFFGEAAGFLGRDAVAVAEAAEGEVAVGVIFEEFDEALEGGLVGDVGEVVGELALLLAVEAHEGDGGLGGVSGDGRGALGFVRVFGRREVCFYRRVRRGDWRGSQREGGIGELGWCIGDWIGRGGFDGTVS